MKNRKIFRIDDIGASTKYYNQHSKNKIFGFWFFKRMRPFRGWAKYEELSAQELTTMINFFEKIKVKPIFAVTACWVEKDGRTIPYPEKFPNQAMVLKKAYLSNKIIIANHGLTHCIPGKHLPIFFGSNKKFHREFWSFLSQKWHNEHINYSQNILENWLGKKVRIFVPPGNVWCLKTYNALLNTNINIIMSCRYMLDSKEKITKIKFHDDREDIVFHDRDVKLNSDYLNRFIKFKK